MNIKKTCATCLTLLAICSLNCAGGFAYSSKSLDDIDLAFSEYEPNEVFTDYKEVKVDFETPRIKKHGIEEPEMKKIIIDEGVETIDDEAFYGRNDIVEVIIPKSVEYINAYAFANCANLNNIVIEGDVFIGEHAFENCENLIEVSIKGKINDVCMDSFLKCKNFRIIRLGSFRTPSRVIWKLKFFNTYRDEFGDLFFNTIVI